MTRDRSVTSGSTIAGGGAILVSPSCVQETGSGTLLRTRPRGHHAEPDRDDRRRPPSGSFAQPGGERSYPWSPEAGLLGGISRRHGVHPSAAGVVTPADT